MSDWEDGGRGEAAGLRVEAALGGATRVLVHPHAPEAGDANVLFAEEFPEHSNVLLGHTGDLLDVFGRVLLERFDILIERHRFAVQRHRIGVLAEIADTCRASSRLIRQLKPCEYQRLRNVTR